MNSIRSPAPGASLFNIGSMGMNKKNNAVVNAANTMANKVSNAATSFFNTAANKANAMVNTVSANTGSSASILSKGPSTSQMIFIAFFFVLVAFVGIYWKQIGEGFSVLYDRIRVAFGAQPQISPEPSSTGPEQDITEKPQAPQNDTTDEKKMVEKILPGRQEVFNISKNRYTYYDAEPLCKALGSELATYDQVKAAYEKGADWCNYGWVKGQMAVYPTQKDTWEQLQNGDPDQRDACGTPGVNGGFFDNAELRFGVNCYGVKPDQKEHDATVMTKGEGAPLSPGELEFQKKVSQYRGEANSIGILPFSKNSWSS
jgi:hypothetical protein